MAAEGTSAKRFLCSLMNCEPFSEPVSMMKPSFIFEMLRSKPFSGNGWPSKRQQQHDFAGSRQSEVIMNIFFLCSMYDGSLKSSSSKTQSSIFMAFRSQSLRPKSAKGSGFGAD